MASVNVSEEDFGAAAHGANALLRAGHREAAEQLDKLARKINAALSKANVPTPWGRLSKPLGWEEMPSTLQP